MTDLSATKMGKWPWLWLALAIIVVVYLVLAYAIPPGADTLWRLHIAQGLLDGKTLYRDMIEVNPPLWFWGAVPAAAMGGYGAIVAINLVAGLLGSALFGALAGLTLKPKVAWSGALALLAGLLLVSVGEIGQREQAFLLACALWSAMAAARIEAKAIPVWLIIPATLFAAYGFALKHYFVLVPIGVEAIVLWHSKRAWRPLRLENLVLAFLAMLYAFAVIYVTPDFLGRVLGLVQASYFGFGPWNSVGPFERQMRLILQCTFALVPIIAWVLTRNKTTLVRLLMIVLAISVVIIVFQQKGWRYHLIGANGLSLLAIVILLSDNKPIPETSTATGTARRVVPLGLAVLVWTAVITPTISTLRTNGQPIDTVLADIVNKEPRTHHIAVFSTAPDNAFYPAARAGRAHWSRHYSMWMMPGLLTPVSDANKDARRLFERGRVLQEFSADLMCVPPDLIVGEVGYFRNPELKLFDAMAFLSEDPAFVVWLNQHYRRAADIGNYPIWRLKGPKPASMNCTKLH